MKSLRIDIKSSTALELLNNVNSNHETIFKNEYLFCTTYNQNKLTIVELGDMYCILGDFDRQQLFDACIILLCIER